MSSPGGEHGDGDGAKQIEEDDDQTRVGKAHAPDRVAQGSEGEGGAVGEGAGQLFWPEDDLGERTDMVKLAEHHRKPESMMVMCLRSSSGIRSTPLHA